MSEHYYAASPDSASHLRPVRVAARGIELELVSDNGVFSKDALDDGTRRLIETVLLRERDIVLDLGTGYGPVSAVLGHVYPETTWVLVDINERAVNLAMRNTSFMSCRRSVQVSDGIPSDWQSQFDAVILNPPIRAGKRVIYRLFRDALRGLRPGGTFWVVIQKKHGAPSARAELLKCFAGVRVAYKKSGYFVFAANKN